MTDDNNCETIYRVASLADLANHFETRAKEALHAAKGTRTKRSAAEYRARADAYEVAAYIVRNTTIDPSMGKDK